MYYNYVSLCGIKKNDKEYSGKTLNRNYKDLASDVLRKNASFLKVKKKKNP